MALKRFWMRNGRIKIKICGFTSLDTAYEAATLGVDALGFHVWSHYDVHARVEQLRRITKYIPHDVSCWLLTDIIDGAIVRGMVDALRIDTLQLQGAVTSTAFRHLMRALSPTRHRGGLHVVKSISAAPCDATAILQSFKPYGGMVDSWLLDSGWKGGTGRSHDWRISADVARQVTLPLVLAGGLNTDNVGDAIDTVAPYGVDVESGVEVTVGMDGDKRVRCKSIAKIAAFVEAVHGRRATREATNGVSTARHVAVVSEPDRSRNNDMG